MKYIPLLIIGAGPIGLSCAIAAKRQGVSYQIIEKGSLVNSIHNFPDNMTFFSSSNNLEIGDIPFTSLSLRPTRHEALEYYRRVTEHFDLNLGLYESFESIKKVENTNDKGRFLVTTSKETYTCDYIINSTGFFGEARYMNVPGEELKKVEHYFKSAHPLFKQKIVVIGASNSAIDVALEGFRKGAEVTVLIRGNELGENVKYWVKPDFEGRVKAGEIKVYYGANVTEITETEVYFNYENKIIKVDNDMVFAMTGYQPNLNLLKQLEINIDSETGEPNYDDKTMETNAKGIYLAGVLCGGLNTGKWYIENTRDHGDKIMEHIKENR